MGQLQVRQIIAGAVSTSYGAWHDVPSPGWLIGFVLPNQEEGGFSFSYEFRNAPEDKSNDR